MLPEAAKGGSVIIRNSAKCNTCDVELESVHRHDFQVHACPNKPITARYWVMGQAC